MAKLHTLTYWVAPVLGDSPAYNLRGRTKKAVLEMLADEKYSACRFAPVHKVQVEYTDAFSLVEQLRGEGSIDEGSNDKLFYQ